MKTKLFLSLILTVLSIPLMAQWKEGEIAIWGTGDDYTGNSMVQTTDRGYAIAGTDYSFTSGNYDFYVAKLDNTGNLKWTKTIGGLKTEVGYSIVQAKDKGYAITGYTFSFGDTVYGDVYIVKLDSVGNLKWTTSIGGSENDQGNSIIQTKDGGYILTGQTSSFGSGGVYVVKLDSTGILQWTRVIGGYHDNGQGNSIIQTNDGDYVVAGSTTSFGAGGYDVYVIKLDSVGNLKWTRTIGGTGNEFGQTVIQSKDGGYTIAGNTSSYGAGSIDMYIIKLDASGNLQWTRTVGGTGQDFANSIVQTADGGYAVAGTTNSYGDVINGDMYLVKLDSTGNMKWTKTIGGSGVDGGSSIVQTADHGYTIAGSTESFGFGTGAIYVVKLDSIGNNCVSTNSGGVTSSGGSITTIDSGRVSNGGIVNSGGIIGTGGLDSIICRVVTAVNNDFESTNEVKLYPNPCNGKFIIRLPTESHLCSIIEIYNILEEKVYSKLILGNSKLIVDLSNQPSGVYFLRMINENGILISSKKIVIQN